MNVNELIHKIHNNCVDSQFYLILVIFFNITYQYMNEYERYISEHVTAFSLFFSNYWYARLYEYY